MKPSPVILLGIDGGDYAVFNAMIARGYMPNLRRIFEESELAPLDGYVHGPGQGWASCMTGQSPAKHGIYYWTVHQGIDSSFFADSPLLWQELNLHGFSTGIVNMSYTYPPTPVDGFMIAGLGGGLSPTSNAIFAYPSGIMQELSHNGIKYVRGVERTIGDMNHNIAQVHDLVRMTAQRVSACCYLLETKNPDLFFVVFRGADAIQHSFWRYLEIESPMPSAPIEFKNAIAAYFEELDKAIHTLWTRFLPGRRMIISDHGFCLATATFHVNEFLAETGFLHKQRNITAFVGNSLFSAVKKNLGSTYRLLANRIPALHTLNTLRKKALPKVEVAINWEQTNLYSKDGYGACLNPYKQFTEKECQTLLEQLRVAALTLVNPHSGKPVFKDVYPRQQLAIRRFEQFAPDFAFEYHDESVHASEEINLGANPQCFKDLSVNPLYFMSGLHKRYGILITDKGLLPGIQKESPPAITDIYATVMAMFGLEAKDCDGTNLTVPHS